MNHSGPYTLAIDIGGTHVKASVLDAAGAMIAAPVRVRTHRDPSPKGVLQEISDLAVRLPRFDRISVGFPGYVKAGRVMSAPNLGTALWQGVRLDQVLAKKFKKPARVLNDADVQGFGVISGRGLVCVLTLGTGIGSSLFEEGRLLPHLELGQHPIRNAKTYDQYLGDAVLKRIGVKRWNRRLRRAITIVDTLINFDTLHLGGGNSAQVGFDLPPRVKIASNSGGITGGIRLWDKA
jgi:polyphosphate glucokinase